MEDKAQHYAAQLAESRARLKELEEKGDAACSTYDLNLGYDAKFNKRLIGNHIKYYEDKLRAQGGIQKALGDF